MLKIRDANGKLIWKLTDDATEPEKVDKVEDKKVEEETEEKEEGDTEDVVQ